MCTKRPGQTTSCGDGQLFPNYSSSLSSSFITWSRSHIMMIVMEERDVLVSTIPRLLARLKLLK
jgi:hypothetical protein